MATQKKVEVQKTEHVWVTLPTVIDALKLSRQFQIETKLTVQKSFLSRGVNATIILLAAASIEGFLTECLEAFGDRMLGHDKFDERLLHFYLSRVSWASIEDKCKLFNLPLGNTLGELMGDIPIQKDFEALCKLRNCLAHANSFHYSLYEFKENEMEFFPTKAEIKSVRKHLLEIGLLTLLPPVPPKEAGDPAFTITGIEEMFTNKVADHYADLSQKYMEKVIKLLPQPHKSSMKGMVDTAFGVKVAKTA